MSPDSRLTSTIFSFEDLRRRPVESLSPVALQECSVEREFLNAPPPSLEFRVTKSLALVACVLLVLMFVVGLVGLGAWFLCRRSGLARKKVD